MKAIETGTVEKSKENMAWFNRKGYKMTGETLTLGEPGSRLCEYVVFKGKWTRYDTVRDCGDHWIYAGYSSYYRIDKKTFEITNDVEDE